MLAAITRQSTLTDVVGADALDAALLQGAQQLDLHRHRHALDLVEEQRAAVGVLELADAAPRRAGEGADLVAEQFAVDQVLRQAAAVQRNEMAAPPLAVVVQAARHQVLAGAGLAVDDHVGRCRGQRADQLRTFCICAERPISAAWMPCQPSSWRRSASTSSASAALLGGSPHHRDQLFATNTASR